MGVQGRGGGLSRPTICSKGVRPGEKEELRGKERKPEGLGESAGKTKKKHNEGVKWAEGETKEQSFRRKRKKVKRETSGRLGRVGNKTRIPQDERGVTKGGLDISRLGSRGVWGKRGMSRKKKPMIALFASRSSQPSRGDDGAKRGGKKQ